LKKSELIASFADVISCDLCDEYTSQKLLRDNLENVPQPGYIGKDYEKSKLLLVGQNPGLAPDRMLSRDKIYTKSLRDLASLRTIESYDNFYETVVDFVPEWPVNRNYVP
jgi:uracil-DNA glycosylase